MFEQIISLITPQACLTCGSEGSLLCSQCQKLLPSKVVNMPHQIAPIYVATAYEGVARDLVHAVKFARAKAASKVIAQIMHDRLPPLSCGLVTHVPTASSRIRIRGYDQAALIARHFARLRGLPYAPLLGRLGQCRQLGQGRAMRSAQLRHAFYAKRQYLLADQYILLIDDVITTGSTIRVATAQLCAAGASQVTAGLFAAA